MEFLKKQMLASAAAGEFPRTLPAVDAADARNDQPTSLTLEVETFDSQVKVIDAAVANRGAATDAFLTCARSILKGQILFAPAASTGDRLKNLVDLTSNPTLEPAPARHAMRRHR